MHTRTNQVRSSELAECMSCAWLACAYSAHKNTYAISVAHSMCAEELRICAAVAHTCGGHVHTRTHTTVCSKTKCRSTSPEHTPSNRGETVIHAAMCGRVTDRRAKPSTECHACKDRVECTMCMCLHSVTCI